MAMFILETMVPWVDLEGFSAADENFSAQTWTVKKLASSVDAFDSRLLSLEAISGLEVEGGAALSINSRRNQSRSNGANGGKSANGIVNTP